MTRLTDRDLFAVEHPEDAVKAGSLPLVGELPNMPDMVHFNLHFIQRVSTDTTRLSDT